MCLTASSKLLVNGFNCNPSNTNASFQMLLTTLPTDRNGEIIALAKFLPTSSPAPATLLKFSTTVFSAKPTCRNGSAIALEPSPVISPRNDKVSSKKPFIIPNTKANGVTNAETTEPNRLNSGVAFSRSK